MRKMVWAALVLTMLILPVSARTNINMADSQHPVYAMGGREEPGEWETVIRPGHLSVFEFDHFDLFSGEEKQLLEEMFGQGEKSENDGVYWCIPRFDEAGKFVAELYGREVYAPEDIEQIQPGDVLMVAGMPYVITRKEGIAQGTRIQVDGVDTIQKHSSLTLIYETEEDTSEFEHAIGLVNDPEQGMDEYYVTNIGYDQVECYSPMKTLELEFFDNSFFNHLNIRIPGPSGMRELTAEQYRQAIAEQEEPEFINFQITIFHGKVMQADILDR